MLAVRAASRRPIRRTAVAVAVDAASAASWPEQQQQQPSVRLATGKAKTPVDRMESRMMLAGRSSTKTAFSKSLGRSVGRTDS